MVKRKRIEVPDTCLSDSNPIFQAFLSNHQPATNVVFPIYNNTSNLATTDAVNLVNTLNEPETITGPILNNTLNANNDAAYEETNLLQDQAQENYDLSFSNHSMELTTNRNNIETANITPLLELNDKHSSSPVSTVTAVIDGCDQSINQEKGNNDTFQSQNFDSHSSIPPYNLNDCFRTELPPSEMLQTHFSDEDQQSGNESQDNDTEDDNEDDEDEFFSFLKNNKKTDVARNVNLSLEDSLMLHLAFAERHHLSKSALKDLLALTKLHLPKPNNFPTTVNSLYRSLNIKDEFQKHYFCENCKQIINKNETCKHCKDSKTRHFIYSNVEEELKGILKRPHFQEGFKAPMKKVDNVLRDYCDGKVYQDLLESGIIGSNTITLQMNSDGVKMFNSCNYSVWPIYLRINELPPALRKLKKFRVLVGIWFGEEKPYMRSFLRPLVEMLKQWYFQGIQFTYNGEQKCYKVLLLSSLFDLPAKCLVQETVQFNGYYGCSCCEIEGEPIMKLKGTKYVKTSTIVFPMKTMELPSKRTKEKTIAQAMVSLENNLVVNGIRGLSVLGELTYYDIIWGVPFDTMHGAFLGVTKRLLGLWFDTENHKNAWYLGKVLKTLDSVYLAMTPPDELSRQPRSIVKHRNYFKANEFRNWLYYYGPVIMLGFLLEPFYSHFLFLVKGIYTLQKLSITQNEIESAEEDLKVFVFQTDKLYGLEESKANFHNLVHYADNVRNHGPLWASMSGFCYEDWNGDFKYHFHGTRKVEEQVTKAISAAQKLPIHASKMLDGSAEKSLYNKLVKRDGKSHSEKQSLQMYGPFKNFDPENFLTQKQIVNFVKANNK
ncbi:uncharacterized protein [Clytia hemisphaerica]